MRERRELLLRFLRSCVPLMLVLIGITSIFIFPEQRLNLLGSILLIAFSYFTIIRRPQGQFIEFVILLSVLMVTIYAYFSESLNGLLFIPQILYFLYQMGRLFIFKELRQTFRYFKRIWIEKKG